MHRESVLFVLMSCEEDLWKPIAAFDDEFSAETHRDELYELDQTPVTIVESVFSQYDSATPDSVHVVFDPETSVIIMVTDADDLAEDCRCEQGEEDCIEYEIQEVELP